MVDLVKNHQTIFHRSFTVCVFSSFVSQLKQTVLFIQGAYSKIPAVSLWVSFMSAHPGIPRGNISCEQSYVELQHLLSPWRGTHPESPLPTALLKDRCQHLLPLPAVGTCRWRERTGPSLGCNGRWACLPRGKDITDVSASVEFHHWCPVAPGAN